VYPGHAKLQEGPKGMRLPHYYSWLGPEVKVSSRAEGRRGNTVSSRTA